MLELMNELPDSDFFLIVYTLICVYVGVMSRNLNISLDESKKQIKLKNIRALFATITITLLALGMYSQFEIIQNINKYFYYFICVVLGWSHDLLPATLDKIGSWGYSRIELFFSALFNEDKAKEDSILYEKIIEKLEEQAEDGKKRDEILSKLLVEDKNANKDNKKEDDEKQ